MGLCDICAVSIKRGQNDSITCFSCLKLYHLTCVSLKQDDLDYLNSLNKSWSCVNCAKKSKNAISVGNSTKHLSSLSTNEPDLKLIISHLDNLRAEQTKLIDLINEQNEKLNSFDKKFQDIFSQLSSVKNENSVLRNDLTAIKNRVDLLESAVPKSNANHDMFFEFIDRQNRSKNIIVFNVHEQSSQNNTSDTDSITHIFNKLGTDIKPIKISRLGKPNNKPRPLKVELQAATEVFKILGLSRILKSDQNLKDIRITSDKSPYQRELLRDLRNQLRERISKGEPNLTIKYYKGQPTIISSAVQKN
ncbi:uncharacterized protein LOC126900891 [Daktulosphaira vitifoliae]|uniref:uncharacterized protein LOC126900891 n=1 Tax=Daktulosphaira vitifoliae TaxID=58002 RepID=UPI0021A98335|nr:uncharacterized protein LOC126900891 [Daktulosphaira vitifoliae]